MYRLLNLMLTIVLFATVAAAEERQEYRNLIPGSRVVINSPSEKQFRKGRPVKLILYALPNGNTIEETEGRGGALFPEEWRYDIQHIAAQVRFLRENDRRCNYVVAYLESEQKGWTTHAAAYPDSPALYKKLADTIFTIVRSSLSGRHKSGKISVVLSSHSGGGRFVLNYIRSVDTIPSVIERILFLDSNYGYEEVLHADKLVTWLKGGRERHLGVMAYVDTTVILNGKRIVSSKGGTGFRSAMMAEDLQKRGVEFTENSDTSFVRKFSKNRQVAFWIKENPAGKIYHTILVERNGLIHQMLFGSEKAERGYKFWGIRSYGKYIK